MSEPELPPIPGAPPPVVDDADDGPPAPAPAPAPDVPILDPPSSSPPTAPEPIAAVPADQRLPPIALLFLIAGSARGILPVLLFLFISRGGADPFMAITLVLFLIPAVIGAVGRYMVFSYRLEDEELVIRDGILTRKVRSVPYGRIQNVDLVQNLFHRLLNVAVVRLETASGGKPEAVIRVLTLPAVEDLRRQIQRRKAGRAGVGADERADSVEALVDGEPSADTGRELLQMSAGRLALLGLLSNRGMLVVAAAAGLAQQAGVFDRPERYLPTPEQIPEVEAWLQSLGTGEWSPLGVALAVAAIAIFFLVGTRLLSVLWVLVTLYGFRLRLDDDDLRTEYGLLTRVTATVPRHRIQLLSIKESFLQERLGLASIQIETAGGGAEEGNGQGPGSARLWLAPLFEASRLAELVREALPRIGLTDHGLGALDWQPLAPNARLRLVRRGVLLIVALAGAAAFAVQAWALLAVLLLPAVVLQAHRFTERTAWAVNEDAVFFRSGAWGLRTSMVPFAKIQGLRIVQTPFDRRNRMASVRVDTAGASQSGHRVDVPYLETSTAHRLVELLEHKAAELEFRW